MNYPDPNWAEKRKSGIARYLFIDGVLFAGGPFAVLMQVIGYFFLSDEGQTFGQYFTSSGTWVRFFLHATLFGLVMASIYWWRNERHVAVSPPGNN